MAEYELEEIEPMNRKPTHNGKGNGLLLYFHHYSFYSQKVVMALYEKKLPFKTQLIDITKGEQYQPQFLQINPRGEIPVLQDGIKIIPDSGRIIDYLEDNFSNGDTPRLIPQIERHKIMYFRSMIDQLSAGKITMGSIFHPEFTQNPKPPFIQPVRKILLSAEKNRASNLRQLAEKTPEVREVLLEKAKVHEMKHEQLLNKQVFENILGQVDSVLREVEIELSSHTEAQEDWWLCGTEFSVADISLAVLLHRLECLGLENLFWAMGKRPKLSQYYNRVQQRESFKKTVPSALSLFKMLFALQNPVIVGLEVFVALALIIGGILYFKKAS